MVYRISQSPTVGRRLSKKSFGPRIQWLPVACAIGSHGVLQEDPSEKMTFLAKRRDATSSAAEVGKMRMVLYGFLWFYMVLYVFIWFYNRPLKQDVSKPITCDVTGKKFRISSSSNGDRAVQWWVTSCWRVNLAVKHVGKSWWKLIWVLFATTERERSFSTCFYYLWRGTYHQQDNGDHVKQRGKKTMIAQMYTDMCRLMYVPSFWRFQHH